MYSINLSLILSLIGCITGCAGLFINFHRFLTEQFRLKIHFAEESNYFFEKLDNSNYKTNYQGVIKINFVNKSSSPVTVYEIKLKLGNQELYVDKYESSSINLLSEVFTATKYSTTVIPMDKQVQFPLRIAPYDSYEGCIFLPFFPDTDKKIEKINFTFKTTKRIIKNNCTVSRFETIVHDDYHDDYI